jgi:hypothetical protein
MTTLRLTVNGQTHHLDVPESRTLARFYLTWADR